MKPSIYEVGAVSNGTVYIMPKPSGEWLDDDLNEYRAMGIDKIVSLLEPDEAADLGLVGEAAACSGHGIDFAQFSIPDRGVPELGAFRSLVEKLIHDLNAGTNIAIHCRAGIGRTGILASCILIRSGVEAEQAIRQISMARGVNIPDTEKQMEYILTF